MRMKRGFSLGVALGWVGIWCIHSAFALTMVGGGYTVEDVSQAPWIFLGEVVSTELLTDADTPVSFLPRWQAQYTRFRVIQAVKGPFSKGDAVELKECGPRHVPSHSFCGGLYSIPPNVKAGEVFFVVTGPGNPNVFKYQTSVRLPANRVPKMIPPERPDGIGREMGSIPWSESGWLIDLSRLSTGSRLQQKGGAVPDASQKSHPSQGRHKGMALVEDKKEPLLQNGSTSVDFNRLTRHLEGMGVK